MRPRNKILWLTLGLTAVFAGPIAVLTHSSQSQDSPAAPVADVGEQSKLRQLRQLEADLAKLKALDGSAAGAERDRMEAQLKALKQQMSDLGKTLAAFESARQPSAPDASSGEPRNIEEAIAEEEEATRQMAQLLEGTVASEPADPSWSVAAAQEISRNVSDAVLEHTQVGEVRCQSTLCRIEASHDSAEAEQVFIMQLGQLESFRQSEGFGQRVQRSDGSVATTLFVSRSGHRLPEPSAASGS